MSLRTVIAPNGLKKRVRYNTQRTHIAKWLADYDTPGYYGRQKPGGGAKNFYNRFKSPAARSGSLRHSVYLNERCATQSMQCTLRRAIQQPNAERSAAWSRGR